ncbi:tetratricopeptide repeat protein [Pollutibacter soli]|uniref:tetratricopeptide repeat protein n=1 Tax=Pollutibacter soli TaxID=3034157 RepID=UPI003013A7FE
MKSEKSLLVFFLLVVYISACNLNSSAPEKAFIHDLHLKTGEIISCGPPDKEFGTVSFETSCDEKVKADFNTALALLHSFEYDESEKMFAKIIDKSPGCAIAYWGVAMSVYHALWEPPSEADLIKGSKAVSIAKSIYNKSELEAGLIDALAAYYKHWEKSNPRARSIQFEKAMEDVHNKFPANSEVSIFYALSLNASADPSDGSYINQKKAGAILDSLYKVQPNHPGIVHYIIHTYDYPVIASLGLPAAKRYAQVAPSSAHALHMPSHIYTRLGMWDDCAEINLRSVEAAKCYAHSAGIMGHWDEELHGLDYIVYAYLQKGDEEAARKQVQYIETIKEVHPVNFKVAYTFAASPARVMLENRNWQGASELQLHPSDFPWQKFPWQESIVHFARLLGAVHTGEMSAAKTELATLSVLRDTLIQQNDKYKSNQVQIQVKTGEAWIASMENKQTKALTLMKAAADMEDSASKHPVTPGEVLPARELYADMLFQLKQYDLALQEYEMALQKSPNRFNSLYGAGVAAEKLGDKGKAINYYEQLVSVVGSGSHRPELIAVREFLKTHNSSVRK